MMTGYYIVIDKNDPNYDKIIDECNNKHSEEAPGCLLSIVELKGDLMMIKVKNGDQSWVDKQSWKGVESNYYTPDEKQERLDFYYLNKIDNDLIL